MPRNKYRPGFSGSEANNKKSTICEWSGCEKSGDYPAPKSRTAERDYSYFCIDHVREYNKNWDYFQGLTDEQIVEFQKESVVGHRPTWKFGLGIKSSHDALKEAFYKFTLNSSDSDRKRTAEDYYNNIDAIKLSPKEKKALNILGLSRLPDNKSELKKHYKYLVKTHHPDVNQGKKDAEEKFKEIQAAYDFLKNKPR